MKTQNFACFYCLDATQQQQRRNSFESEEKS